MIEKKSIKADLNIIILNFNGKYWLEKNLFSLRKNYMLNSRYSVEVTVVDNGSNDDSVDFVLSVEWAKLIESGKNGGFAFGNNLALKKNKAKYVMLLNSDTEIPESEGNLDLLIDYMEKNEKTAVITPRLVLANGLIDDACHRGEPTPWASFCHFTKLEKIFPKSVCFAKYHQTYKDLNSIHQIDACTGAAMLVRNSAIEKTGLLDERFFMYAEDLDWCRRFREMGYVIIFNPYVTIIHHKYKSGFQSNEAETSKETRKWFYGTLLQYYDKHYAVKYPLLLRSLLKLFVKVKSKS